MIPSPIISAVPKWPGTDFTTQFWLGLNHNFKFTHHASNETGLDHSAVSSADLSADYYCPPEDLIQDVKSHLVCSKGGSLLVTGYRGTGKTSLVYAAVAKAISEFGKDDPSVKPEEKLVPITLNLNTASHSTGVLYLLYHALEKEVCKKERWADIDSDLGKKLGSSKKSQTIRFRINEEKQKLLGEVTEHQGNHRIALDTSSNQFRSSAAQNQQRAIRFQAESLISASQEAFCDILRDLADEPFYLDEQEGTKTPMRPRFVFIIDELDKLPVDKLPIGEDANGIDSGRQHFVELQRVAADLKFLFSEANCHQIFIAGKDVDDSWHKDENKREGLFESIFARNVYLPSLFRSKISPPTKLHKIHGKGPTDASDFYKAIASLLGIPTKSLTYNTALIILPHLAPFELYKIYRRQGVAIKGHGTVTPSPLCPCDVCQCAYNRIKDPNIKNQESNDAWIDLLTCLWETKERTGDTLNQSDSIRKQLVQSDHLNSALSPATERSIRRIRILLQYLTYKGRGIPRKILREFYGMVRHRSLITDHPQRKYWTGRATENLVAVEQHELQRMGFYADIVEHLERHFDRYRQLNDKGRVSTFHIIDYILKFYSTGFTAEDISHARFVTTRQEVFPSQLLAEEVIGLLEGRLIRRKDRRSSEFRLLPRVSHDLFKLLRDYSAEQIEIRFTDADFEEESRELQALIDKSERASPEYRMESPLAQMWLGVIEERLGRPFNARLAYSKAAWWIRAELERVEQNAANYGKKTWELPNYHARFPGFSFSREFFIHLVSNIVPALHRLGRMHEEQGDFPAAFQCYDECVRLHMRSMIDGQPNRQLPEQNGQSSEQNGQAPEQNGQTSEQNGQTSEQNGQTSEQNSQTSEQNSQTSEQNGPTWPYGEFIQSLMLDPSDLENALMFTEKELNLSDGIRPMKSEGQPDGLVHSLNLIAVLREKMWERSAANLYYIKALNYLHHIQDEYGVIDQMAFIGQVMMRRRDLKTAARWYLKALKLIDDIQANDPGNAGWKWSTTTYQPSVHAQILSHLGDIAYATGGLALFDEGQYREWKDQKKDRRKIFWEIVHRTMKRRVVYDHYEEYFYAHSRILFESTEDEASALEIFQHQMHVRGATLLSILRKTSKGVGISPLDEDNGEDWYDLICAWNGFWKGMKGLIFRLLDTNAEHMRDDRGSWGQVRDRRRMGFVYLTISDVLKEISIIPAESGGKLSGGRAALAAYIDWAMKRTAATDESRTPIGCELLTGACNSQDLADFVSAFEANSDEMEKARLKRWDDVKPSEELGVRAEIRPNIPHDEQTVFEGMRSFLTSFNYVNGDTEGVDFTKSVGAQALAEPKMTSILYQISDHWEDECSKLPITQIYKRLAQLPEPPNAKLAELKSNILLLSLAERAGLKAYLGQRDLIEDASLADTMLNLGGIYFIAIYHLCMNKDLFQDGKNDDFFNFDADPKKEKEGDNGTVGQRWMLMVLSRLHLASKRFLVKAIDIYNHEARHARTIRQTKAAAHFTLGDLMLLRSVILEESEPSDRESLFGKLPPLDEDFKMQSRNRDQEEIADHHKHDARLQVMENYQLGLRVTALEFEDFSGRYRLPPDTFYAHRNIIDPVLHFEIARNVRRRVANAEDIETEMKTDCAENREVMLFEQSEAGRMFLRPKNPYKKWVDWKRDLAPMLKKVNRYRFDRSPLTIDSDDFSISWEGELPAKNRFWYFEMGDSENDSSP